MTTFALTKEEINTIKTLAENNTDLTFDELLDVFCKAGLNLDEEDVFELAYNDEDLMILQHYIDSCGY